jgi:transposase InsO family protein
LILLGEDLLSWSGAADGTHYTDQEVLAVHGNAALTPKARLKLARLIVDDGWPVAWAAQRFQVAWPTAKRWADRYRAQGEAGMGDRSSRPHRSPTRTPQPVVRKIVHLRWRHKLGPVAIADRVGLAPSTVHAVLVRCRLNRLSHVDRVTGEPVRRYEHDHPGAMLHVDVKKLGNVPDGGGWRYVGRAQGMKNRSATVTRTGTPRSPRRGPLIGTAFVHTVIDDHSRVAYAEVLDDETAASAIAVLRRAVAWFAARGVTTERVLSDNGSAYKSHAWADACRELGITHKRTRPYRPQTNGKIERFHRTLAAGWAFHHAYASESTRRKALPAWLHEYNHHRPHTAIGNLPPITRLTNLIEQYT